MTPEELKALILRILGDMEHLALENYSLKAVMQAAQPRNPAEPALDAQVNDLIQSPEARNLIHEQFAPLYEQIEAAAEDAELLEALARYPPRGQPTRSISTAHA